jgi:hypothetical protein
MWIRLIFFVGKNEEAKSTSTMFIIGSKAEKKKHWFKEALYDM